MSSVTIHQVAKAAGVSPSTVSNFLNGRPGRMLPETRARVEEAIRNLGYRPNRAARQLRTGRVQVIGLVVPSVANPFWGSFALHLEGAALAHGFRVLLCNSARDPDRERGYIEELWADGIRGVVLCSSLPSLDHVLPLVDQGLNLVAFDRTAQAGDPPSMVNISVDNMIGSQLATGHLLDLGHRRLAFVSGSLRSINRRSRFRGFREALETADVDPDTAIVWTGAPEDKYGDQYGDLDAAGLGRTAAAELLAADDPPTAVVAINDMCALGVSAGIRDAGLRVGEDVSVVGFDDIVLADLAAPPLTTIRQPLADMAAAAFAHLRDAVEGDGPVTGRSLLIRPELVIRESTGPARPL
ncbi:LacI family DNA-binding transcriptional regulator [Nonomuraea sp. K274]|uniref:LacI family DNA-binding transcriptional regulator n=1 Tax=Nonomuraea cypriaca TaxID=1187855 RepID=A0A931EXW4_9ACTN|nr:LacI family DNA-binding transcriptional regulator [Nonomuraea cypriaca]MBF8188164.1 LacI family DNA-binding transcriptional regulator [Nonomuraea cypriaca]